MVQLPHKPTGNVYGIGELAHSDVCVVDTPSLGMRKYMISYVFDGTSSHYSLVGFLQRKSQANDFLKKAITSITQQSSHKLRALRMDRGGEYLSEEFKAWLNDKGITPEYTVARSKESHGTAEVFNKHIMNMVRSMLSESGLPKTLWAEAAATANYLRNRIANQKTILTPYEKLFGKKPDVSHLRVWGSRVWKLIDKEKRGKLEPKADLGFFVGYAEESGPRAYRVYNPQARKVEVVKNVMFDEHTSNSQTSKDPSRTSLQDQNEDEEAIEDLPTQNEDLPTQNEDLPTQSGEEGAIRDQPTLPTQQTDEEDDETVRDQPDQNEEELTARDEPTLRRSTRVSKSTQKSDFVYKDHKRGNQLAMSSVQMMDPCVPSNEKEALAGPYANEWKAAMNAEYSSIKQHGVFSPAKSPPGFKPIPVRWVFDLKRNAEGEIIRFKARLVVKGFKQKPGIDFDDTWAATSKATTLRALLAVIAHEDMEADQVDVKTAFLHGHIEEEIYCEQPPAFHDGTSNSWRLHKALYGLKQAPRQWFKKLGSQFESMGFRRSDGDAALYVKKGKGQSTIYVLTHVDDMIIASKNVAEVDLVKQQLRKEFEISDLGPVLFFLGMEIVRDRQTRQLTLSQKRYTLDVLRRFDMTNCNSKSIPITVGSQLFKAGEQLPTSNRYAELVGSVMYLAISTRPDLSQAVGVLSRYLSCPTTLHWKTAMGVLKYLKGTATEGITFGKTDDEIIAYSDSDYAGDLDTRRSTAAYLFTLYGGAISWKSKLQQTVAVSTMEAEYMAAGAAVKEALALKKMLGDFNINSGVISIFGDSQSALAVLKNPISSARAKHIDVIHHFAREQVERGEVEFKYISTTEMAADCLTKAVLQAKLEFCKGKMGF